MSNIQYVLFYSQITFAMNAARIMKALAMDRSFNRTERELVTNLQCGMIINTAKVWDITGYNIEKFVNRSGATDDEKQELLGKISDLKERYQTTIQSVKKWRDKLVAHLDNNMNTLQKFDEFNGDVVDIQRMLQDVANLVSGASWYPEKNRPMKFLDYDQIKKELRL